MRTRRTWPSRILYIAVVATLCTQARGTEVTLAIELQVVADGLTAPVYLTGAGDGSGRLFIVDQAGFIRIVKDGVLLPAPFLDLTSRTPEPNASFD